VYPVIGGGVARVEAFGGEVGDFKGVARSSQAGSHLRGHGVGEGLWVVMGNDDECVHDFDSLWV
jgi:hypothetical protein